MLDRMPLLVELMADARHRGGTAAAARVTSTGEDGVEVAGELAVAVADEEAKRRSPLLERPGELSGLLGDPWSGRVIDGASRVGA